MVEIHMKRGVVAMIDDCDEELVAQHSWHARQGVRPYVQSSIKTGSGWQNVLLHRFILRPPLALFVDHVDGNPLNNTRSNLRLATPAQNASHRTRPNRGRYIGVYKSASGKWAAAINPSGKTIYLGVFDDEVMAAAAYNDAATQVFGKFAGRNELGARKNEQL